MMMISYYVENFPLLDKDTATATSELRIQHQNEKV